MDYETLRWIIGGRAGLALLILMIACFRKSRSGLRAEAEGQAIIRQIRREEEEHFTRRR